MGRGDGVDCRGRRLPRKDGGGRGRKMELFEGFEEIAMAFIYMKVGDADDDEIIRVDTEGFPEFGIRRDGIKVFDVDTIRDDSNFFRMHTDVFDIEIFDSLGVGEVATYEWLGRPFEDACDEIFRMIVGRAEEGDDWNIFYSQENLAEHIGMEEIGDDDIRTLAKDELSEAKDTRNIEYAGTGGGFDGDAC